MIDERRCQFKGNEAEAEAEADGDYHVECVSNTVCSAVPLPRVGTVLHSLHGQLPILSEAEQSFQKEMMDLQTKVEQLKTSLQQVEEASPGYPLPHPLVLLSGPLIPSSPLTFTLLDTVPRLGLI